MAIVKCENKGCKYFEEGFYCTKSIVEMTDGKCNYWMDCIRKENSKFLTKDQRELRKMIEDFSDVGIQIFDNGGEPLQYHNSANDLD